MTLTSILFAISIIFGSSSYPIVRERVYSMMPILEERLVAEKCKQEVDEAVDEALKENGLPTHKESFESVMSRSHSYNELGLAYANIVRGIYKGQCDTKGYTIESREVFRPATIEEVLLGKAGEEESKKMISDNIKSCIKDEKNICDYPIILSL